MPPGVDRRDLVRPARGPTGSPDAVSMRRRWKSSWLDTRVATGEVQVSLWLSRWLSLPLALLCVGCRSESSAPVTPQSDAPTAVGSAAASRIPSPVRTITRGCRRRPYRPEEVAARRAAEGGVHRRLQGDGSPRG